MTYNPDSSHGHDPRNAPPPARAQLRPEGDYKVKCIAHQFGSASTGTEQIGIRLAVTEGEHKGSSFTFYGFFTEAAIESTIKAMRALGFRGDDLRDVRSMYEGEGIAVVKHEADRDGVMRERVRWINGADVVMANVMAPNELNAFAARMRGAFARIPGPGGGAPASSQGPQGAPGRQQPPPQGNRGGGSQPPPRQPPAQQGRFGGPSNPPPYDDAPPWDPRG